MRMILAVMALVARLQALPAEPVQCEVGRATMHGAWYQVFRHFPERFDPNVAGFIAVNDCERMGEMALVRVGDGRWWLTRVADCRDPADEMVTDDWLVDVDSRLWAADELPVTPLPAVVCWGQGPRSKVRGPKSPPSVLPQAVTAPPQSPQ